MIFKPDNMKQSAAILVIVLYTILVLPVFYQNLPVSAILVQILVNTIVTVCVFVRHLFSFYSFYFDFHSARIIFDVSSDFYLWNINKNTADICKRC